MNGPQQAIGKPASGMTKSLICSGFVGEPFLKRISVEYAVEGGEIVITWEGRRD